MGFRFSGAVEGLRKMWGHRRSGGSGQSCEATL